MDTETQLMSQQGNSALAGQAEAARGGFEAGASRLKFE